MSTGTGGGGPGGDGRRGGDVGPVKLRKPLAVRAGRDSHEKVLLATASGRTVGVACWRPPWQTATRPGVASCLIAAYRRAQPQVHVPCFKVLCGFHSAHSVNAHRYNACVLHSPKLHTLCSSPALPVR